MFNYDKKNSQTKKCVFVKTALSNPEAGGIRGALLAVVVVGVALAFVLTHKPQMDHSVATVNMNGTTFARNVNAAYAWYGKQSQIGMDQIAINASQQGESYNQCAENSACADLYNEGTDQNVPANAQTLAMNWQNFLPYLGVKYTSDGHPYTPQGAGGLFTVWKNGASMTQDPPIGFWWVYANNPMGQSISLKDYFAFEHTALAGMHARMFNSETNNMIFGAIEPMQGGNTDKASGWTADLNNTAGQMRLLTWGNTLSFPVTGATPTNQVPSLYGLDPKVSGDWSNIVMPKKENANAQYFQGHQDLRSALNNGVVKGPIDPAFGYFFPAVAGNVTQVPSGLALTNLPSQQINLGCPSGYSGSNIETEYYQLETLLGKTQAPQNCTSQGNGTMSCMVNTSDYYTCTPPPPATTGTGIGAIKNAYYITSHGYKWVYSCTSAGVCTGTEYTPTDQVFARSKGSVVQTPGGPIVEMAAKQPNGTYQGFSATYSNGNLVSDETGAYGFSSASAALGSLADTTTANFAGDGGANSLYAADSFTTYGANGPSTVGDANDGRAGEYCGTNGVCQQPGSAGTTNGQTIQGSSTNNMIAKTKGASVGSNPNAGGV